MEKLLRGIRVCLHEEKAYPGFRPHAHPWLKRKLYHKKRQEKCFPAAIMKTVFIVLREEQSSGDLLIASLVDALGLIHRYHNISRNFVVIQSKFPNQFFSRLYRGYDLFSYLLFRLFRIIPSG